MDPAAVYVSAKIGLAELVLSGATTVADHLYLYPNGARIDDEIAAAKELGLALPSQARLDERRRKRRRPAAGSSRRARGRDPRRLAARDRDLPRSGAAFDAAHRLGTVLSVQRQRHADARKRAPRAQPSRRAPAHASGRNLRQGSLLRREVRHAPARLCGVRRMAGRGRVVRAYGPRLAGRHREDGAPL